MESDTSFKEICRLDKKSYKPLFEEAKRIRLDSLAISDPGNMWKSLGLRTDTLLSKITWGGYRYSADSALINLQSSLMQIAKERLADYTPVDSQEPAPEK